uniref:WLM domain-containing protein n=1 Tax=viral metagenome TaxID=1070528 RepID=A0A6M3K0G5_9ZZZZ
MIPEKVKIGGHQYTIFFPYLFRERDNLYGQHDHAQKEIRITGVDTCGAERAKSGIIVTFIHEVLHGIDFNSGHQIFNSELGERALEAMAEGIYQVLIDNGWLTLQTKD